MENQNLNQVPLPPVKADTGFEIIQKILMVFIFILTSSMFSYWGYQAVMYILSVSFDVQTKYTLYDMFIGIIAMVASASLFAGSFIWWRKNINAEKFLVWGIIGFLVKSILEIPNTIIPLTKLPTVTVSDITDAASDVGYVLFKIGFWVLAMFIFSHAIKKHKESLLKE